MGAVWTIAMVMVVGVMNPTMGCADGSPYTGVGMVRTDRQGHKASAAWHCGHLVMVLIYGMVTVQRYSASDG